MLRTEKWGEREFYLPASDTFASFQRRCNTVWHINKIVPYVNKWGTVVQAGGNLGQWPLYLAQKFKTVWTFEPSPINFSCLCLNTQGVNNIFKFQAGLGRYNTFMGIQEDVGNCEGTFIGGEGTIPIVALDSVWPRQMPLDLLLLDVEGFELEAVMGASEIIDQWGPPILLEWRAFDRHTFDPEELHSLLEKWGYRWIDNASKDRIYAR